MKPAAFDYRRAQNVQDALTVLAERNGEAKVVAGGCSLGPMLNLRLTRPPLLVDVRAASDLRQLSRTADALTIGAGWTHSEIEDGVVSDVTQGFMSKVASGIAFRPIRNRGTIGGSIAHADPSADWITAIVALDASIIIQSRAGIRREPAASFIYGAYATNLGADELITAIEVPTLSNDAQWSYYKICRKTGEFAMAIGAAVTDPARNFARVVCGAVEAAPLILSEASAALLSDKSRAAAIAVGEIETMLNGHDNIFRQLHAAAVERAVTEVSS